MATYYDKFTNIEVGDNNSAPEAKAAEPSSERQKIPTTNDHTKGKKTPAMYGALPATASLKCEPLPFKAIIKSTRCRSDQFARDLSAVLRGAFHDFKGTNLLYTGGNNIAIELYFEYNPDPVPSNKIRNLVNLTSPTSGTDLFAKNQVVQHKVRGESYTINDETKLLLSDYMFGGREANEPTNAKKWGAAISEIHMPTSINPVPFQKANSDRIIVKVTNLNINYVAGLLYGKDMVISTSSGEDGEDINTHATAKYVTRFNKFLPGSNHIFIFTIDQADKGAVEQTAVNENPFAQVQPGFIMY